MCIALLYPFHTFDMELRVFHEVIPKHKTTHWARKYRLAGVRMIDLAGLILKVEQIAIEGVAFVAKHHNPTAMGTFKWIEVFIPAAMKISKVQILFKNIVRGHTLFLLHKRHVEPHASISGTPFRGGVQGRL
jgi:hypothetical protein